MSKLTLKEKISYGLGDFGNGFMFDLGQAYLLKFYTDVCGIASTAAGGIFLFTKVFDAFMDPIAGIAIDSRKNIGKNGRFKPIMFFSSILLAILTVITFTTPVGASAHQKLIYGYATYMIWGLMYSFTNVPYGSLASVMTQDVQDRANLASFRQAGSVSALLITGVAFMPIVTHFSDSKVGFPIAAGIMSLVGVISFFITFKNTKEVVEVKRSNEKVRPKDFANAVFTNKPLLTLILMTVFSISAYNIKTSMMVYFCQYYLGNAALLSRTNFFTIGSSIVAILFIPTLVKKLGKKRTAILGFSMSFIADGLNFILPVHIVSFTILMAISFIGIALPNGATWAFVSDVIDYGEWHTGERREGITYSAFNFSRKIAQAIAGSLSGFGLALIGYVPNVKQSAQTLLGMKGLLMLYPCIALIIAAIVLGVLYGLSDKKYKDIVADLQAGRYEKKTV
ncbi:glycoside-pentoside-hexuronide (GPH):cation symporter [Clostridium manihotivorum]|uniref:MFS transporter n=1 Tax=Clostridium manihotivorum TaxID=2320868 RepID=A0A3R5U4P1_9CLOT|nr:glycoside-pentoside-hexuronide (GPH):cation symporter [Clostridium manihotivorum]QAA31561.1 MFS transporter [Clostridium manihotivorum]